MSRLNLKIALLALVPLATACPSDDTADTGETGSDSSDTTGDGDGDTAGDGDGDGDPAGDGDGDPTGDGDGDTSQDLGPVIDLFNVNGSDVPPIVDLAMGVEVLVEASDPDGTIVEVRILVDGDPYATLPGPGPFVTEYLVGGEAFNGFHDFQAIAVDDDGLETIAGPVQLSVAVTGGAEIEVYEFDNGPDDEFTSRLFVDSEGSNFLVGGIQEINGDSYSRIDRFIGESWADKTDNTVGIVSALTRLSTGDYLMAGWGTNDDTVVFRYDASGSQISATSTHWTPPGVPESSQEFPLKLEADREGNYYGLALYQPIMGDYTMSLTKFSDDGTVLWTRSGDEDNLAGSVATTNMDISEAGIVVAGETNESNTPWMGRYTLDGEFVSENAADNQPGLAWDAAIDTTGASVVSGYIRDNLGDLETWVTRYGANGQPQWSKVGGHAGEGIAIATDIDVFGDIVVASLEGCNDSADCDLYLRKYDPDGNELWEQSFNGGNFSTLFLLPMVGDITTDRFGYIYVTAPYRADGDFSWWAAKLHP